MTEFKAQDPKFFSFMSTDSEGFNSFFHCLIFYDEINEAEITYDTDNFDSIKKHLLKKHTTFGGKLRMTDGSDEEEENDDT